MKRFRERADVLPAAWDPRSSFPPQPLFALTLRCSAGMRNTSTEADGKSLAGC
jgi:hypothetical protein